MLWVLVCSKFSKKAEEKFARDPFFRAMRVKWRFYIFAGDIALTLVHENPEVLLEAADISHNYIAEGLAELKLDLSRHKCNNVVLSPNSVAGAHFRRNNNLPESVIKELPARGKRLQELIKTFQTANTPVGVFLPAFNMQLPYQSPASFRILGVQKDATLGGTDHYTQVFQKASKRHGVMAFLAQRRWGLEVGTLSSAHSALLTSLVTYGLAAMGGTMYEGIMERLEVQQTNIAARRITGVSRSARLATLHMVAGVISARNLYIQQCGIAVDRAVRTHSSKAKMDVDT